MKVKVSACEAGRFWEYEYDEVTVIEVKWVDEAGWYCYVLNMADKSTATFTAGQSSVSYWNVSQNAWMVI